MYNQLRAPLSTILDQVPIHFHYHCVPRKLSENLTNQYSIINKQENGASRKKRNLLNIQLDQET